MPASLRVSASFSEFRRVPASFNDLKRVPASFRGVPASLSLSVFKQVSASLREFRSFNEL